MDERPLIAIVDDDDIFLAIMQELLEGEGYRAVVWAGGDGAIELIQQEPPTLLILDLRMERVEAGQAVLQRLRLDPATRALPVIVCSADGAWLRDNGEHLRAKGYALLAKPFDLDELLDLVATRIGAPATAATT